MKRITHTKNTLTHIAKTSPVLESNIYLPYFTKGLSIKDIRGQGEGVVQCGHFSDKGGGGSSDVDVRTFWCKSSDFSKFMVCPREQRGRGLNQCGHFANKAEGVNYSRFCADVFYGLPLTLFTNHTSKGIGRKISRG